MKLVGNALVEAKDFSCISDGRTFLVGETHPRGQFLRGAPSPELEFEELSDLPAEQVMPINETTPCSCAECGNLFKQKLHHHSGEWMYTYFICDEHPSALAVVDIFPKVSGYHSEWDWSNTFAGLGHTATDQQETIWKKAWEEAETNRYTITPDGIERIKAPRRGFLQWFAQ